MGQTQTEDPQMWDDRRLSEMCAAKGSSPVAFGYQASAWRTAANHFMAAHNAGLHKRADDVDRHRRIAYQALQDAGLRVEQACVTYQPEAQPHPEPGTAAETALRLVGQSTRRMLWLRDAATRGTAQHAAALGGLYGAAALYERAVRDFSARNDVSGHSFWRAAEHMLAVYRLRAPWHTPPAA